MTSHTYRFHPSPRLGPPETISIYCYDPEGYQVLYFTVNDPLTLIRNLRKGGPPLYEGGSAHEPHYLSVEVSRQNNIEWRKDPRQNVRWISEGTRGNLAFFTPNNASFSEMLKAISQLPIPEDA